MLFFSFYLNALSELMAMTDGQRRPHRRESVESIPTPAAVAVRDKAVSLTPAPPRSAPLARPRLVAVDGEIVAPGVRLVSRRPQHRQRPLRLVR